MNSLKPYDVNAIANYIIQCLNVDDEGMKLINLKSREIWKRESPFLCPADHADLPT